MKKAYQFGYPNYLPEAQQTATVQALISENAGRLATLAGLLLLIEWVQHWLDGSSADSGLWFQSIAGALVLIVILLVFRSQTVNLPYSALRPLQAILTLGLMAFGLCPALFTDNLSKTIPMYLLTLLGIFSLSILPLLESLILAILPLIFYAVLLLLPGTQSSIGPILVIITSASGLAFYLSRKLMDLRFRLLANQYVAATQKAQIESLAQRDSKTSLFNEAAVRARLSVELARAIRHRHPLCLLVLEIDDADAVLQSQGIEANNRIITGLAQTLNKTLRTTDILGRSNDGHFIVVLPDTELNNARIVAGRIQDAIARFNAEQDLEITVGCGITQHRGESMEAFILVTDARMHQAKKQGQNQIIAD